VIPAIWSAPSKPQAASRPLMPLAAMLDDARGWRLAEMRKRRGLTQEQVAARMGVSVARVSQIEGGDVSTQDVLNRFITALGGTLKLIADFGDEQLKIA
jgi:transcriptional regulator with XRE-family HTH domain